MLLPRSRSRSGPSGRSLLFDKADSSSVQIRSVQLLYGVVQATAFAKFDNAKNKEHFNFLFISFDNTQSIKSIFEQNTSKEVLRIILHRSNCLKVIKCFKYLKTAGQIAMNFP